VLNFMDAGGRDNNCPQGLQRLREIGEGPQRPGRTGDGCYGHLFPSEAHKAAMDGIASALFSTNGA